jgi:hypothetical protein
LILAVILGSPEDWARKRNTSFHDNASGFYGNVAYSKWWIREVLQFVEEKLEISPKCQRITQSKPVMWKTPSLLVCLLSHQGVL